MSGHWKINFNSPEQQNMNHKMDHSKMDHSKMNHKMDHSKMVEPV